MKRKVCAYRLWFRLVGWVWWLGLVSACTLRNEIRPAYRLAGKVVTAGTEWPVGVPVNLGLCYHDDTEARNPLVMWTTDSAGCFDHRFSWRDDPDKLRMVLLNMPARHFAPTGMPSLSSRTMTNLRIELPAVGWLRMQLNLATMGQGGMAMVQAGTWLEIFYLPELVGRTIPWNSMMPLQFQVTYRPTAIASSLVSYHNLRVPPLDTVGWTWTP